MAISLKHLFQSAKSDGADNTVVQPSDWNDEHVLTQATGKILGRTTAGAGATEEISPGTGITLSSTTISVDPTAYVALTGGSTGAANIPAGTTGERPTGVTGHFRYNTSLSQFEGYNGTTWGAIGGGGGSTVPTGGGSDAVFYQNDQIVTTDYTITTNKNAGTFGPVTINSGVTVTVPSGSTWTVV
jgi:hypothetical protein